MGANSSSQFSSASTAEQVGQHFSQYAQGKTFLVTGAGAGLGLETVRVLALLGARVILTCRTIEQSQGVADKIRQTVPKADLIPEYVELSSLESVFQFVDRLIQRNLPIHVLILNAGIMACPRQITQDGFESQFAVNHLSHFALTTGIESLLRAAATQDTPARVISLSSMAQFLFPPDHGISFDDLAAEHSYDPWRRYGESKLANVFFAKEINRRWSQDKQHPIIGVSLHPGAILNTQLARHFDFSVVSTMMRHVTCGRRGAMKCVFTSRNKSIPEGTATTLFCSLNPDVQPGQYYDNCEVQSTYVHPLIDNEAISEKLWKISQDIIQAKKQAK